MKRFGQLAALIALAATALVTAGSPSTACTPIAPGLVASPTTVAPGDVVSVSGSGFLVTDPSGTTTTTTSTPAPVPGCDPVKPGGPVPLFFVQGDRTVTLATAHPDAEFGFETTIAIPVDAEAGAAVIVARADYLTLEAAIVVRADAPLSPPTATPTYTG